MIQRRTVRLNHVRLGAFSSVSFPRRADPTNGLKTHRVDSQTDDLFSFYPRSHQQIKRHSTQRGRLADPAGGEDSINPRRFTKQSLAVQFSSGAITHSALRYICQSDLAVGTDQFMAHPKFLRTRFGVMWVTLLRPIAEDSEPEYKIYVETRSVILIIYIDVIIRGVYNTHL